MREKALQTCKLQKNLVVVVVVVKKIKNIKMLAEEGVSLEMGTTRPSPI